MNLSDDDKRELKSAFDDNISKILNRLSRFRLNSYRLISILEGVTKLISLGVVSNNSGITQSLNKLFENFKKYNNENKLTQETLEFLRSIPDQAVPARHIETDDLRLTPKNI
ncbi:hypothetical protein [Wolbachia endosymbiont (group E) of Neria commutata]|uniref:hypothetical protein n=1 Tax=Wolbachia endosymbiont (group E) of Neria commutata TaxID=3066149 RepID=UPI0031333CE2